MIPFQRDSFLRVLLLVLLKGWILGSWVSGFAAEGSAAKTNSSEEVTSRSFRFFRDLPAAARKRVPASVDELREIEKRVQLLLPGILPAVVSVSIGNSSGSGVIISPEGYVLTAAHVSEKSGLDARFTLPDGRVLRGKTLGANHELDAGLMKITETGPWPFVDRGQAGDTLLGDWVLTIGHPGGYEVGRAPVVRLGRVIRMPSPMLQTDCTITAGDSGGPLFDLRGSVIGIHSRISDSATENFHSPIQAFNNSWERLMKGEVWGEEVPPERPSIGARGSDHDEGCLLEYVEADGPAGKIGVRVGDILHAIDGERITGSDSFRQRLRQFKPGQEITLEYLRGSEKHTAKVKVGVRKQRRREE
jgi:serine protease Do